MQRYDAVVIGAGVGGMTAAARLLGAFTKQATKIGANFAARARLIDAPGLVTFGRTERLCNMGELTATCPELAPLGWRQYVAYAVPKPALGNFDEKAEIEASRADLRAVSGLRRGQDAVGAGDARRVACAGFDLAQDTPLANLWHVDDAVKDYGDGGTQACAFTAREAARKAQSLLDA